MSRPNRATAVIERAGRPDHVPAHAKVLEPMAATLRAAVVWRAGSVGVAILVSKLLTLFSLGYAARVLGPENWGRVGVALAAVAYSSVVLSPGLMAWGTRQIARDRSQTAATLLIVNLTQFALASGAFVALLTCAWALLDDPAGRLVLAIAATSLFAQALSVDWVFDGLEQPQTAARLQMLGSAARLAMVVALCRASSDVLLYAALLPLWLGVQALAGSLLLARRGLFAWVWPGSKKIRQSLAAAWPLGLTTSLFMIVHNANTLIVDVWLGSRAAGQYLAAFRVVEMASVLPGVLGTVFRPRMARLAAADPALLRQEIRLYERVHVLAGFLIAALLYAEAPGLVAALYGAQYLEAVALLRIFSLAVAANYLVCGSINCLQAFGADRVLLRSMALAALVSIGAGLFLTPRQGLAGAALAASLIHPVTWMAAAGDYRRLTGSLALAGWTRPLGAAATIVLCSRYLDHAGSGLATRAAVYTVSYAVIAGSCWTDLVACAGLSRPPTVRCPPRADGAVVKAS